MEIDWCRSITLAAGLILGVCSGASLAAAQAPGAPRIWDIAPGTQIGSLPSDFVEPACGTNGGPPGRVLPGFDEFTQCPLDQATGLYEVAFQYDDLMEFVARARRNPGEVERLRANAVFGHPVRWSILVDDRGRLRGFRIVTDERAELLQRQIAYTLSYNLKARFGAEDWSCEDLPRLEGESPVGGQFVKERCQLLSESSLMTLDTRFYRRPGQHEVDPHLAILTEGQFISSTRLEALYPEETLARSPVAGAASIIASENSSPPEPANARTLAFLDGNTNDCAGCDLAGADLRRRDLSDADLSGANLEGAILHRAVLRNADLTEANLSLANLNLADLSLAILRGANLSDAMLYQAVAQGADFSGANLFYASGGKARLALANFEAANLELVDFGEARLNDARLVDANLTNAYLQRAVMLRADLTGVTAQGAVFAQANLGEVIFQGADVSGADLFGADLQGADLRRANFSGSRLWSANLYNTLQEDTQFEGAMMPGAER